MVRKDQRPHTGKGKANGEGVEDCEIYKKRFIIHAKGNKGNTGKIVEGPHDTLRNGKNVVRVCGDTSNSVGLLNVVIKG